MDVEKDVKIKVISKILPKSGEQQTFELWVQGTFIHKSEKRYLRYEEYMEEQKVRTTVKLDHENPLILRSGAVNMRLPFNLKRRQQGHYDTIYGTLPLETKTNQLTFHHIDEEKLNGTFQVEYDLMISGQSVGQYTLEIQYTEGQS